MTDRASSRTPRTGERRLPMALAVLVAGGLFLLIPEDFRVSNATVVAYPAFLLVLLGILIVGDPGRIDREKRWLRVTTGVMIAVITVVAAISAFRLVVGILDKADFATPGQLLAVGAVVWITQRDRVRAVVLAPGPRRAGGAGERHGRRPAGVPLP